MSSNHPALQHGNAALVTGAASGIGLATARKLVEMGLRVCLADREEDQLREAVSQLAPAGDVFAHVVDVADEASVAKLGEAVDQRLGRLSFLMNNAGTGGGGDALSSPEGWRRVLGVNLFGVLNGVQRFAPAMVAGDKPGIIVNTGSKQGITQPPGDTAYNVSKSGVKALTEGLAHTLREKTGTRISAHLLVPGFTYTGMTARRMPEKPPSAWTPEQVADRLFLAIDRGEFYVLCEDNETTRAMDEKRILWAAQDMIENRPALSRWHPDYKDAFAAFMKG